MRDSTDSIVDLSPDERRTLLAKLLQEKTKEPQSYPPSFAQEWLWFFDQLEPGNPYYNIPYVSRINGWFDLAVAQQVVSEIVRRHEVLRTTFAAVNGKPVQIIAPSLSLPLAVVNIQTLSESQREEEVKRRAVEEARRPFDLAKGPLLRVTLLQLGEQEHILLVTMHHIISDGWSGAVFIREAMALYEAFSMGAPSPLPELPLQYGDYAVWQRQWLKGEALDAQLAYWKGQLAGLPLLDLPTDRPRPAVQSYRGARQPLVLSNTLTAALKALSRREGVTLFMTLLAAFKVLLSRYTGQYDIVVGSPIAGRNRAEIEGLIGLFVSFLILRTRLKGDLTFRELLRRVCEVCQAAYAHQDLPVEKLAEILRPKRGKHYAPLFQVALDFEPVPLQPRKVGGLAISPLQVDSGTAKVDFGLSVRESEETLTGFLEYSTDLFDASTMTRMLEHYVALLEAIVANPEQSLLSLPCLNEAERRQLWMKRYKLRRKGLLDSLNDVEELSNLTKNQLLLWVGQQLQPDVPLYNLAATLTIRGEVDRERFKKAFQTLINSSDALRTVIQQRDGVPQQGVITDFQYLMEYVDFSHLSDPDAELRVWTRKQCQVRFDFGKCLFDSVLIKLSDKKFVWYLNQHHIITDGWSVWLIFNRMAEFYERSLAGRLEERVELRSFQHYIDDEREYRSSSRYLRDDAYWKEKLAEESEPIAFYGKTPLKQTTRVQRISYDLGFERTRKLRTLAAQRGISASTLDASLFNSFVALLCTYLYRISGNGDISFGTPIHNRRSKPFEETIGSFVEVLPLRVKIEDGDTFLSLVKKVKVEMFETLRHGRYSIRNPLHRKAYDVLLNYHHMSNVAHRDYNGAPVEAEVIHTGYGNDSLGLRILDFGDSGSFTLDFDFHRDVFDDELQGQAIQHFLHVLDAFLEDPTQLLNQISLLTAQETQRILLEFNETGTPLPENQTIVRLFEAQVERTPDNVAVVFEEQRLTYRELNRGANQVAHHLRALGVGPEVLVAICLERSVEMVIGLLGILKAGGAYVPLDPAYPKERLAFMLEDSQARVLLTKQRFVAELIEDRKSNSENGDSLSSILDSRIHVVCPDTDWVDIARQSEENPISEVAADNLAYVIYTSGSTGRPKGVMIPHRAICNHMLWMQTAFPLNETDRVVQKTPFSFDASVWEFFAPLLTGACLVLAQPRGNQDSTYLVSLMAKQKVTVLQLVPSLLEMLLEEEIETCTSLRHVFCGGEPLPVELQERFTARLAAKLHNLYGPTEATIDATFWTCKRESHQRSIPIGRPISNTQVYVLDSYLQPVPVGIPGELHIGGVGLARGYLNRPELTAERFICNPFSDEQGAYLYKTGDLARFRSDGALEYLGRMDRQVKIRGFRIEVEEIEAVLGQHPAVRKTLVLARDDVPGDKRLVAYVVPKEEQAPAISELRSLLKEKLPEYMVPSAFMLLDVLPLTPNGKLDRRALPAPDHARLELEKAFVAPRTPAEEVLAGIWAKVLRIERLGVYDNFFELGGDSILSIQIIAKANQAGLRLSPKQLFEHQTIAELATVVGTIRAIQAEQGLVTGSVPLTPIQLWFFEQDLPERHHFSQALLFEIRQALNPSWLERVIHQLLMHHDALRLRFVREEARWQQVNMGPEDTAPFTHVDLSALLEAEQRDAIETAATELKASLNLSRGPLMRVVMFKLGPGQPSRLLVTVHHLAVDAMSWRILLEDLLMAYLQLSRGEVIQLPPKTTSFKQWAERLREYAQSDDLRQELDYWLTKSRTRIYRLPVDHPGGANTVASANSVRVSLSAEETRALLQDLPKAYHTQVNDVLLTALAQAFAAWTGESFLLVDLEGHGREELFEDVDLSRTVGWFTTHFPVLLDLGKTSDPEEALKFIKEQLRLIPNRGIGYGLLRYINEDAPCAEKLGSLPQPEVRFNYLGQFDQLLPEPAMFALVREFSGPSPGDRGSRSHLLEVNGGVAGAELHIAWTYSGNVHRRSTIESLAQNFVAALRSLITHCQSPEAEG